jgi:hypothetical protein
MRFRMEHTFDAAVERIEQAILEPAYQERLRALPNVAEREVTELQERPDGSVHRVVRYKFGGNLPGIVTSTIGTSNVSWDEVSDFDPANHRWTFEVHPHVFKGRFQAHGRYDFTPNGDGTVRILEVEVKVHVPLVGGRAERAIGEGLLETMGAEARILATYLAENPA